jgi:PAS domain S-box-containing protein
MDPILDTAPCGFLSVDEAGTVLSANTTLAQLVGIPREQIEGSAMDSLLSPAGKIFYSTHLFPLLRLHGRAEEVYLPLRDASGREVAMLVNAAGTVRDGRTVYDLIIVPMRQRNELENELLAARTAAEQAAAAKDRFLSIVSHELRTPLSAVRGYADLLLRERVGSLTDGQRRYAQRIRDAASSQANLIVVILDFARQTGERRTLEPVSVALEEALERVEALLAVRARESGLHLRREPKPASGSMRADPRAVQQILLNLGTNALKFSPPRSEVHLLAEAEASRVRVRVRDSGIGIAPGDFESIFEPFVQLQAIDPREGSRRGVGLGLSISRELARAMGGNIEVSSVLGEGSTFTLELPAAD